MNPIQTTVELHKNGGFNCAQAIITAFGSHYGIDADRAKALGRAMAAGMARTGGICGYLSGALLVISLAYDGKEETVARAETAAAAQTLLENFKARHGCIECKGLLGADFSTEAGRQRIAQEKLVAARCYGFGQEIATILTKVLPSE